VKPDDALFRREAARLLATLTRAFGVENLALAEDVVQETLAVAFEAWLYQGVPEHYAALLTTAAKNRALDAFRREGTARKFAPEVRRFLESERTLRAGLDALFLPDALKDDELRMMFSCCHPRLREDVQVALVLHMLCSLGVEEIASAFLVSPAAISKRLSRGKATLSESKRLFELTAADFAPRLSAVHRVLYLLFSEGYHGANSEAVMRVDLCREALRLVRLLVGHCSSATPTTCALAALMCLHAARLPGRADQAGRLRPLVEQDRSRWDAGLTTEGFFHLARSAEGELLSEYHVEAGIAALHASARSVNETNWAEIVRLYAVLMKIRPSPVVALNRAMAIAEHEGPARGLAAIGMIDGVQRLAGYPFYPAAVAELEFRLGRVLVAKNYFELAKELARNEGERRFLEQRIEDCARMSSS
jgi:RNA polymerase sigma-70 factor (ECF subfamily)